MSMFLHLVNKKACHDTGRSSGGSNYYCGHRPDSPALIPPLACVWPWLALGFLGGFSDC